MKEKGIFNQNEESLIDAQKAKVSVSLLDSIPFPELINAIQSMIDDLVKDTLNAEESSLFE